MADEQNLRSAQDTGTPSSVSDVPPQLPDPASLGDRLLAQAVDGLIALGIFFSLGMALAGRLGGLTEEGFNLTGVPALILIGILIAVMLGYFIIAEGFFGMTLGKLVAEIKVTNADGGGINMRASIIRNLMRFIDGIGVYLVGAFSVILTSQRVRLGDLVAGTVVLRRDTGRVARAGALLAALLLAVGGIWGGIALRDAPAKTAGPISATLALGVSANHEPINPTTTFSPDVAVIHVAFRASRVQPGSRLKAIWTVVNIGAVAPPNSQLAETSVVLPGPAPGNFRFRRGAEPWPVGDYRVDLYLNEQLALSLPYRISR